MESSTVMAFRIFVMLSCLIIVPMAAIFGSAFPDVVKSVLVDRIVALSTGKPVESAPTAPDPNGFREVRPEPSIGAVPGEQPSWEAPPRWEPNTAEATNWRHPDAAVGQVVPASGPGAVPSTTQPASFQTPPPGSPAAGSMGNQPPAGVYAAQNISLPGGQQAPPFGGVNAPSAPHAPAPYAPPAAMDRTASPVEQPDRFTEMERRLRELGATYYLLETWGNGGELYRFHCRMAVAGNAAYSRHFEATDRDGLKAMADVLSQVEAWRSGALQ